LHASPDFRPLWQVGPPPEPDRDRQRGILAHAGRVGSCSQPGNAYDESEDMGLGAVENDGDTIDTPSI
jgi:hypothetical protein